MTSRKVEKVNVAVVGFGNVGRFAAEAIIASRDMQLVGVVRRQAVRPAGLPEDVPVVIDVEKLGHVDVALLAVPTRMVEDDATAMLRKGINTVDSFDIHNDLVDLRYRLDKIAKENGAVALVSCGWDPGTDSIIRTLFEVMAPKGITYTNFGPGMSMGHTVAAKAVEGVRDALSMTFPVGAGVHRRLVYVELEEGASIDSVRQSILQDAYFVNDDTKVIEVPSVRDLIDVGHGTVIERKGVSGQTHNQRFHFEMQINNPALTSQVMVSAARATMRQHPGAYTMPEVPPIDFLPGDRDALLRRLV